VVVKLEYFLNLADSAEFASLLAPLEVRWGKGIRTSKVPKQQQALPPGNQIHTIRPLTIITTYTHRLQNSGYTPRQQSTTDSLIDSSLPWNMATTTLA